MKKFILNPNWPQAGQAVNLVAPAGQVDEKDLKEGLACLQRLGAGPLREFFGPEVYGASGAPLHLAGRDDWRARMLDKAFCQGGLVMAIRGGFGSSRLLSKLEWRKLQGLQPCLLGFSDISVLLNNMAANGLVALHGPNVVQLAYMDADSLKDMSALLNDGLAWPHNLQGVRAVNGNVQGALLGGNLSMLCHLLGTPYAPDLRGAILFLEEVNEPAYRLDRLLTQLELAGVPEIVAGVALGGLHGYHEQISDLEIQNRLDLALLRLRAWHKPLVYNLPFGHGTSNRLLPVGADAAMENDILQIGLSCGAGR